MRRVAKDGWELTGIVIDVDEGGAFDAIAALPADREGGIVFLYMDWFRIPITGQPCGELSDRVQQQGISRLGSEQDKLTDGDDAPVRVGGTPVDVEDLDGEKEDL